MVHQDTIRLLRECDAGTRMGVQAIEDVLPHAQSEKMKKLLQNGRAEHQKMQDETSALLKQYRDDGKSPPLLAQGMAAMKTRVTLAVQPSDAAAADLITDGCNMGVKSLSRYLNEYAAADEKSKALCKKLIALEEGLAVALRDFL